MKKTTITREADISSCYRYELRRIWEPEKAALIVIGLNPSKADSVIDGNTITVLINFASRINYGKLVMLNMYAYRATKPSDLINAARAGIDVVGPHNTFDNLYERIIRHEHRLVFAAWGSHGVLRGNNFMHYLPDTVRAEIKCFAVNRDGSPHHPLRISLTDAIHPYPYYKTKSIGSYV